MEAVEAALEHKAESLRRQRLTYILVHTIVVAVALESQGSALVELVFQVKFADVFPSQEGIVVVAYVPIDEEAVIEPTTREEELDVGILKSIIGGADIRTDLYVIGEVAKEA